jgi:predicted MFS family arabinose efflux permease
MRSEEGISQHTVRDMLTRDFVLGFFAFFVFLIASYALIPTLPIYFARLGSNEMEIGVLLGIFGVASLVSRLLVGGALLKYSEKGVMMFGAILFGLTFVVSIVLRPFWPFFAVRIFQGIASACMDTAAFAFIVNVIPPAYRAQGLGYFLLATTLAMAIAPFLGMMLINQYSFTVLFLSCTGVSLCAFFFSWRLKGQEIVTPHKGVSAKNNLFLDRKIVVPAIMNFLHNYVFGALIAFLPLYAIHCGITNPGYFFSAMAIMLIVGRTLGGRILDTYSIGKIILTSIFFTMIAMVILSFSKTLPMFICVGMLWGTGMALFLPASMAYALDYAGSSSGPAIGTFRAISDLGVALGPMVMGLIVPLTGFPAMFLCLALICLINLSYFQFYLRKRRNVAPTV